MAKDYQLVRRLDGGGMAEVYLARRISRYGFGQMVVLKRVGRSMSDYERLEEMLLDEARATACFSHANIVSLIDAGEDEHGAFLAIEYVEGSDLQRVNSKLRSRREALPFELACLICGEVLRGLHYAHGARDLEGRSLDVIHRDVNPSNVLIANTGHVKLTDFGVVRMRNRIQDETSPGVVKGKYGYLAPEYIAGEACSRSTDVYATGVMLFELLTGRECFSGTTAYEVMWKVVNDGVPVQRLEREGVPAELRSIVERATVSVPERRFQTAEEMADALETWLIRSGRHASPWVLSVFFSRHDLFARPDGQGESGTPLSLEVAQSGEARPTVPAIILDDTYDREIVAHSKAREIVATPPPEVEQLTKAIEPPPAGRSRESALGTTDACVPLRGKLEDHSPAEVLDHVVRIRCSGVLEFRCGLIWKRVQLVQGVPTEITSNMGMELIGEHLVNARLITRRDLDRALMDAERDGQSLTAKLLELGLIDRPRLEVELGKNLSARLSDVLEWRWGAFEFAPEEKPVAAIIPKFNLAALLEESLRAAGGRSPSDIRSALYTPGKVGADPHGEIKGALTRAEEISGSTGRGRVEELIPRRHGPKGPKG